MRHPPEQEIDWEAIYALQNRFLDQWKSHGVLADPPTEVAGVPILRAYLRPEATVTLADLPATFEGHTVRADVLTRLVPPAGADPDTWVAPAEDRPWSPKGIAHANLAQERFKAVWGTRGVRGSMIVGVDGICFNAEITEPGLTPEDMPLAFEGYPLRSYLGGVARLLAEGRHEEAALERVKQRFLAIWGKRGVACGIGANPETRKPRLRALIQSGTLQVSDLPATFEGYEVDADYVGEIRLL